MSSRTGKTLRKIRRAVDQVAVVPDRPQHEHAPAFDPKNYPPGDLPTVPQEVLRAIASKPHKDEADLLTLTHEHARAQRKIGHFNAGNREDREDRAASANNTASSTFPPILELAKDGVSNRARRKTGGVKTGEKRRAEGEMTRKKVLAENTRLGAHVPQSERAGIISRKIGRSKSQVRRILAAERSARTR